MNPAVVVAMKNSKPTTTDLAAMSGPMAVAMSGVYDENEWATRRPRGPLPVCPTLCRPEDPFPDPGTLAGQRLPER